MSTAPSIQDKGSFAALPETLADLTRRVVRKARLWPSERRELAAELESHFREGLIELTNDGVSLEQSIGMLCEDFGDPDLAARLIHRSKKRGRPMIWKVFTTIALVVLVVGVAGGGYLAYVSFGSPTPSVDYIAKINEPAQKTLESDRAWPILREALLQFRPMPQDMGPKKTLPKPGDAQWSTALAWVESNRAILPLLKVAALKPAYGFIYDNERTLEFMRQRAKLTGAAVEEGSAEVDPLSPPTLGVLLPHLSELRSVAKFLVLDARERLTRGEFAEAWDSLDMAHRVAALLYSGQTIIEQLVGAAMMKLATSEMRSILHRTGDALTAEQLARAKASHLATMPICTIKGDFGGELIFFKDVVQYVFTDDGSGNGHLIPSQFSKVAGMGTTQTGDQFGTDAGALAMAAVHADRRATLAKHQELWDRMHELYALPLYDPRRLEGNEVLDSIKDDGVTGERYALIRLMLPALSRANELIREAAMNELAARAILAILQYRLDKGTLPERLGELGPDYLAAIPIDEYSGMHLRYVKEGDGFMLYSVGSNLLDDGGSSKKITGGLRLPGPADLVYWPPALD